MKSRYFLGIALVAGLAAGCKKDAVNNLSEDETRIYITNYDTTANFSSYKTFSVSDSVAVIQDDRLAGKEVSAFDTAVISAVKANLVQRGYQLVEKGANPDLAVNISRVYNTYTGVISYPYYWDDYYSYWDPYYWGYPGYGYYAPYATGIYSIQTGGLNIDLLDLKNASANGNKLKSVWSGLARGEGVFRVSNASSQVNALFSQSSYLKVNN